MNSPRLFMFLIGCTPAGRHTEQHDVFFCIGENLDAAIHQIFRFWPDGGRIHIDAWREVSRVADFSVTVIKRMDKVNSDEQAQLFFINLGGYRPGEFEEYHYKMLSIGKNSAEAISLAKSTAFYKHTGFKGAESHIDDKYGVDVDDIHNISDILPRENKKVFSLQLIPNTDAAEDECHIGYFNLQKYQQQ